MSPMEADGKLYKGTAFSLHVPIDELKHNRFLTRYCHLTTCKAERHWGHIASGPSRGQVEALERARDPVGLAHHEAKPSEGN